MDKNFILKIDNNSTRVIVLDCGKKLEVKQNKYVLAFLQAQGLPGPSSDLITGIAGENIETGKVVYYRDGFFYNASFDDPYLKTASALFFAFSNNSALLGAQIQLKLYGFVNVASVVTPNTFYYLGSNGDIVGIAPTSGIILLVGQATTSSFLISFGNPIILRE
ncbi:MAG: hypothetical protein WC511_03005 [Candidatus Pacearchaeota archaeon]